MAKKIKFIAVHEYAWEIADKPFPASQSLPKWWKKMPIYIENNDGKGPRYLIRNMKSNLTGKRCMPMYDGMTNGYLIPLWADVVVERREITRKDGTVEIGPYISWKTQREVFEGNIEGSEYIEAPSGYGKEMFKFINMWCIKTPPGYSVMITSPSNRNDSPFRVIDAVVDTDKYDAALPTPMFLLDGFEGVIRAGTPIMQVIPFKRTNWESEFDFYPNMVHDYKQEKTIRAISFGNYIKTQWSKKSYK